MSQITWIRLQKNELDRNYLSRWHWRYEAVHWEIFKGAAGYSSATAEKYEKD